MKDYKLILEEYRSKLNPNVCKECILFVMCRSRFTDEFAIIGCPYVTENIDPQREYVIQVAEFLDVDPDIVKNHLIQLRGDLDLFLIKREY